MLRRTWRPILAVTASAMVTIGLVALDRHLALRWDREIPHDAATTFFGTVAGTMITATVVVFWIRGLLVSNRTGYVPNRVLSGYLDDPGQQWLMGFAVGIFVAASVALFATREGSTPSIAVVTVAGATVTVLVAIIHSISAGADTLHEQRILRRIVDATLATIERDYPDDRTPTTGEPPARTGAAGIPVYASRLGWLRSVDDARLLAQLPVGSICRRHVAIGTFVSPGQPLCTVWQRDAEPGFERRIEAAFELGSTRSPSGDISFGIRNLVDIALAGAANGRDRTSTREAIEHLGAVLRPLATRAGPARAYRDADGRWMIRSDVHDFVAYADDALEDLSDVLSDARTRRLLHATVDQLIEAAEDAGHHDRARLLRRHAAAGDVVHPPEAVSVG